MALNTQNLNFLIGRSPIVIPHGILPSNFMPIEGSVYDSFAPGLPPVIYINGQFYPLADQELGYLRQQFAQPQVGSGRGPEGMPQMPVMPSIPNPEANLDSPARFERAGERQAEQKQEQPPQQPQPAQPAPQQATTPAPSSGPQPIIDVKAIMGQGRDFISQDTIDQTFDQYKQGKLNPKANPDAEAVGWIKLLLAKLFESQYRDDGK